MTKGLAIVENDGAVTFTIKVVPGSSRTCLGGIYGDMLKVKISAAPEKGKANDELTDFLAKLIGVKRKTISIVSGKTNPVKQIKIEDVSVEKLRALLK